MSATYPSSGLAKEIRQLLGGVRRRIRTYVILESLAVLLLWLGVTFWVGLAVDYFPILVIASELPRGVRMLGLFAVVGVSTWILYRFLLRRLFTRLTDRSMAIVLERRYDHFHDGLVTAVEMHGGAHGENAPINADMLDNSMQQAVSGLDEVSIGRVFNTPPLVWKWVGCVLLLAPIGLLAGLAPDALRVWTQRMYLLRETPWPRNVALDMVGIETVRPTSSWSEILPNKPSLFVDRVAKVAKGSNVRLRVRADAHAMIPDYCVLHYRSVEGGRGHVNIQKAGPEGEDWQGYAYEGKPLRGVLTDLKFDVVGFDHRLRGYRIEVVDSPAVVRTMLDCDFPKYLQDDETSNWSPREIEYQGSGIRLPRGTRVTVRCEGNKPLKAAYVVRLETGERIDATRTDDEMGFSVPIVMDGEAVTLEMMLLDTDDIVMDQPFKLSIQTAADEAPEVDVRLAGIGSAVTPDFIAPVQGEITDDYKVDRAWFEVTLGEQPPRTFPVTIGGAGRVDDQLDFRLLRSEEGGLRLAPGNQLRFSVVAADRFDLDGEPNKAANDAVVLDVVTPAELLAILERRELALRQRFEILIEESVQLRDSLLLVRSGYSRNTDQEGRDPADAAGGEDAETQEEKLERRRVRVRHGISQSQKIAQELLGVSVSFGDIRLELVNNRVDSEDRKQRIEDRIEKPLRDIAERMYPELDTILERLENDYKDPESATTADNAIAQANDILVELNGVLEAMVDIESFNELMDLVRKMIDEQEDLLKKTDKKREANFFDSL